MSTSLFSQTPAITVTDNRRLTVRNIAYHRHPAMPDKIGEHITRHHCNARGFLFRSADPRLHNAGLTNFTYLTDLSGRALRTVSADVGVTVILKDAAGRPFIAISNIRTADDGTEDRSRAVTRTWQYEDATLPGRLLGVTEQVSGGAARVTERCVYAGNTAGEKAFNLAGQDISHCDPAGRIKTESVALTGGALAVTRYLIKDAHNPDTAAGWQGKDAALPDGEAYTTLTTVDATGEVLTTTDAQGNVQRAAYDVAGQLSGSWLTLKGGPEQVIVKSLTYSAAGQKLREEHGNGVVTTCTYEAETQHLTAIKTERPAGHQQGQKVLQDLRYNYDPAGNVLSIRNDAEETRFWRNQKVVPENTYVYDSLYQLVSATGREMAQAGPQGSSLPSVTVPLPADSSSYTHYTRTYTYDSAGNLTQIRHSAPATGNNYTTDITVSNRSNRGVLSTLTEMPSDVDRLFTAGGQQTQLQPGQALAWTPRNELLQVTPVMRDGGRDDSERYRYDGNSQRILKVRSRKIRGGIQTQRVLYLPGLELRTTHARETEQENLQVICVGKSGRAQVRVLRRESGKPEAISSDQVRWSYDNPGGSSGIELDADGNIISMEEYYPYGGTAVWAARSQVEADSKTVRYAGKERDATGLYYYGYRYYQPWAGRWLSADPAGTVDGLNLFRMCRNNPGTLNDSDGRQTNFNELFDPAAGDLLFGLSRTIGEYTSYWSKLTRRGDYLAIYLYPQDALDIDNRVNEYRVPLGSYLDVLDKDSEENTHDENVLISLVDNEIMKTATEFYSTLLTRQDGIFVPAKNKTVVKNYVSHLREHEKYPLEKTILDYSEGTDRGDSIDTRKFVRKIISRSSKAGLSMYLNRSDVKIHFLLDNIDMNSVINKSDQWSITSSELRYLYRNRDSSGKNIHFYLEHQEVAAPWISDKMSWAKYKPKNVVDNNRE